MWWVVAIHCMVKRPFEGSTTKDMCTVVTKWLPIPAVSKGKIITEVKFPGDDITWVKFPSLALLFTQGKNTNESKSNISNAKFLHELKLSLCKS
jgi:hypothetical protein